MRAVGHANPQGASPRLGTLGLHARTALRFDDYFLVLRTQTPPQKNHLLAFLNLLEIPSPDP